MAIILCASPSWYIYLFVPISYFLRLGNATKKSHLTSFLLLLAVSAIWSNRPEFILHLLLLSALCVLQFSQFINKLLQFLLDFKNLPKRHISYIHASLISGDFSKNTCHSQQLVLCNSKNLFKWSGARDLSWYKLSCVFLATF